jgi:hypothetical protein
MSQDQITLAALDRIERELDQQNQVWEAVRSTLATQDPDTQYQLPAGFLADFDELAATRVAPQHPTSAGFLRA